MTRPSTTNHPVSRMPSNILTTIQRQPRWLLLIGVLLVILWLSLKAIRIGRLVQSFQAHEVTARGLLAEGPLEVDPDRLERFTLALHRDTVQLRHEVRFLLPLSTHLGWVPRVGPVLTAAPELMEMAEAGTAAAVYGVQGLKPALILLQEEERQEGSLLPQMVRILDDAEPDLIQARLALEQVAAARERLPDMAVFPERVRPLFEQFDTMWPLARDGLKLALVLPEIMGVDGARTYLLIAQNEDERRATGGFISGAGTMQVEEGDIRHMEIADASLVADFSKPYAFPPQPLYEFMGLELFLFRDSNFWPDFPTSARKAMELYSYTTGTDVDGVIAIDQQFVQMLVCATGPVQPVDFPRPVNCENVLQSMRDAYSIPDDQPSGEAVVERKAFMGQLAQALRDKLENGPDEIDLQQLIQTLFQAVETRHLQLYIPEPAVAPVLAELNWDNHLDSGQPGDFLMVIDTNVGYDKTNAIVNRSLDYHVTLSADGGGQADLGIHYSHLEPVAEPCNHDIPAYNSELTYTDLILDCYWNYVRIYTPTGSELVSADRHPAPAEAFITGRPWTGEAAPIDDPSGFAVFANFFLLEYGQSLVSNYRYRLPAGITQPQADGRQLYQLTVRKQPGSDAEPLQVRVTLPAGSEIVSVQPEPAAVDGQSVSFRAHLEKDLTFQIIFR